MLNKIFQLKNHQGFVKYFKNTSWLLADKVIKGILGIFIITWMARHLGPNDFGILSYALSFALLFTIIANLGLNNVVIRELVKNPDGRDQIIGSAFIMKIFGGTLSLLVLAYILSIVDNDFYINIIIFIIASVTIFQSFNVIDFYFQAQVLSKYTAITAITSQIISSIIKIALIMTNAELIYFAWVVLFDSFIVALGLIYFYSRRQLRLFAWKFDKNTAFKLLKDSWPLIISAVAALIYMRIDQIMIKELLDMQSVGQYAAAIQISEASYFIPMIITSSLFPAIINAKKISQELYHNRLKNLYGLMIVIALSISIFVTFISDWLINLLYQEQYNQAAMALKINIWGSLFVFISVAGSKWIINENLQLFLTINTLIGGVTNIILNYILIPKLGINGAAIASVVSFSIAGYFGLVLWHKTRINFILINQGLTFISKKILERFK